MWQGAVLFTKKAWTFLCTHHSFTASKADAPWLNALQRRKMFSAWPGRVWMGACFITKCWAISLAKRAASRLSLWSSWRSGVLWTWRWRLWYSNPWTSNGVISKRYSTRYRIVPCSTLSWAKLVPSVTKCLQIVVVSIIQVQGSAPELFKSVLTGWQLHCRSRRKDQNCEL